jgi:hypothetical protein
VCIFAEACGDWETLNASKSRSSDTCETPSLQCVAKSCLVVECCASLQSLRIPEDRLPRALSLIRRKLNLDRASDKYIQYTIVWIASSSYPPHTLLILSIPLCRYRRAPRRSGFIPSEVNTMPEQRKLSRPHTRLVNT